MRIDTLHLCNINHILNIKDYISIISPDDAVVFYSLQLDLSQFQNLRELIKFNPVYFIVDDNNHDLPTIDYDAWLDLVKQSKKTLTWK